MAFLKPHPSYAALAALAAAVVLSDADEPAPAPNARPSRAPTTEPGPTASDRHHLAVARAKRERRLARHRRP